MTQDEIKTTADAMGKLSDECAKYCRMIADRDATIAALREALELLAGNLCPCYPLKCLKITDGGKDLRCTSCIAREVLQSPDPGAELLARHAAELEKLGKEVSEERILKREVLHKYADYCIERNEHVKIADKLRQRAEAAESALREIAELETYEEMQKPDTNNALGNGERAIAVARTAFGRVRTMPNGDAGKPATQSKASNPCKVSPKPENAL